MLSFFFIAVLLMASLFNSGDGVVTFTYPAGGSGSASVAENSPTSTAVATITANSTGIMGAFALVTAGTPFGLTAAGALTVTTASLDYEATKTYTLMITGVDDVSSTASTATATLTVSVTDVDDLSFAEDSYSACVLENAAVGTTVTTLSAANPDSATLTYTIESGNTNSDFAISSADITIAKALGKTTSYTLGVKVTGGSITDTANVVFTVASTCSGASALAVSLTTFLIGLAYTLN